MPTYAFQTLNELVTYLQAQIAPNGTQAITGQKHQDVVTTMALSLVNIIASVPPSTVNQFPPYDADQVYDGGEEVIVRHDNKLWLFVHADDQVGVTPGTNGLVWQELSAAQLAHFRNRDTHLAQGTADEVSAADLRRLLDGGSTTWIAPVLGTSDEYYEGVDVGARYVVTWGSDSLFDGHIGKVAELTDSGWVFKVPPVGAVARVENQMALAVLHVGTIWTIVPLKPGLSDVLSAGQSSGNNLMVLNIPISETRSDINGSGMFPIVGSYGPQLRITITGDAEIIASDLTPGMTRWIELNHSGGSPHAITWRAGGFSRPDGVSLPTSISAGERYIMRTTNLGTRVHINSCVKAVNV